MISLCRISWNQGWKNPAGTGANSGAGEILLYTPPGLCLQGKQVLLLVQQIFVYRANGCFFRSSRSLFEGQTGASLDPSGLCLQGKQVLLYILQVSVCRANGCFFISSRSLLAGQTGASLSPPGLCSQGKRVLF